MGRNGGNEGNAEFHTHLHDRHALLDIVAGLSRTVSKGETDEYCFHGEDEYIWATFPGTEGRCRASISRITHRVPRSERLCKSYELNWSTVVWNHARVRANRISCAKDRPVQLSMD